MAFCCSHVFRSLTSTYATFLTAAAMIGPFILFIVWRLETFSVGDY